MWASVVTNVLLWKGEADGSGWDGSILPPSQFCYGPKSAPKCKAYFLKVKGQELQTLLLKLLLSALF